MTIIENMNRAKSRFFEKINKMDKTLFSLTQNKDRRHKLPASDTKS